MRQGLRARWLVTLLSVGVVIALQSRSGLAQVDATANAPARTLPAMPSQAQGAAQLAPPHQVAAAESAPVALRPPVVAAPVVPVAAPVVHGTVPVTTPSAAVAPAAASASAGLAPTLGATGSVTGGSSLATSLPANVRASTVRVVSIVVEQDTDRPIKGEFGLGDTLVVQLEPGNLAELIAQAQLERQPLGLFIGGWFLPGIPALPQPGVPDVLRYYLERTDENEAIWSRILGRRFLVSKEPVHITVGTPNGRVVAASDVRMGVELMDSRIAVVLGLAILLILGLTAYLAFRTAILRESQFRLPDGRMASYSLGRSQMAFWFINIFVSYLFIWAITGAIPEITTSVLTLLGIGGATALGARILDDNKLGQRKEQDPPRAEATIQPSRSFLADLIQDYNQGGYSLPRVQMVMWTGAMFVVFWTSVLQKLTMPDFDNTTLALMGISSGTYLGFKIPEK